MSDVRYIKFHENPETIGKTTDFLAYLNKVKKNIDSFYLDKCKNLAGEKQLLYFKPLSDIEKSFLEETSGSDFDTMKKYGAIPKRYFSSMIENILMGDYEILPIEKEYDSSILKVKIGGIPYGGLDGLLVLLDCMGHNILSYAIGNEAKFTGIHWDWWNFPYNSADADNYQTKLNLFYKEKISAYIEYDAHHETLKVLSSPFCISFDEQYLNSRPKIMFVGKETNTWKGHLDTSLDIGDSVKKLIDLHAKTQATYKKGKFLPKLRYLEKKLLLDCKGKIVWNNLMKMDHSIRPGYSKSSKDYSIELREFSKILFQYETKLLEPDVIIFGTSYRYDKLIKDYFPNEINTVADEVDEKRSLWKFRIGKTVCYRTWHPQSTRQESKHSVNYYYDYIVKDIREDIVH